MELSANVHDQNPTSINNLSFNLTPLSVQPHSSDSSIVNPSNSGTQEECSDSRPEPQNSPSSESPNDSEKSSSNDTEDPLSKDNMDTSSSELHPSEHFSKICQHFFYMTS